jgi:hypothetical protein
MYDAGSGQKADFEHTTGSKTIQMGPFEVLHFHGSLVENPGKESQSFHFRSRVPFSASTRAKE